MKGKGRINCRWNTVTVPKSKCRYHHETFRQNYLFPVTKKLTDYRILTCILHNCIIEAHAARLSSMDEKLLNLCVRCENVHN